MKPEEKYLFVALGMQAPFVITLLVFVLGSLWLVDPAGQMYIFPDWVLGLVVFSIVPVGMFFYTVRGATA